MTYAQIMAFVQSLGNSMYQQMQMQYMQHFNSFVMMGMDQSMYGQPMMGGMNMMSPMNSPSNIPTNIPTNMMLSPDKMHQKSSHKHNHQFHHNNEKQDEVSLSIRKCQF